MRKLSWLIALIFLAQSDCISQAKTTPDLDINQVPPQGILLSDWKLRIGDDPNWASQAYNDSEWTAVNINQPASNFPINLKDNIAWLRLSFKIDSSLLDVPLSLMINQYGASEIYIDGQLVQRFGSLTSKEIISFNPHDKPLVLRTSKQPIHLLAVRFRCNMPTEAWMLRSADVTPLTIKVQSAQEAINNYAEDSRPDWISVAIIAISAVFGLLFLVIYLFYKRHLIDLFFSLFNFCAALVSLLFLFEKAGHFDLRGFVHLRILQDYIGRVTGSCLMIFAALALFQRVPKFITWLLIYVVTLDFVLFRFYPVQYKLANYCVHLTFTMTLLWLTIRALRNRNLKDWFIAILTLAGFNLNASHFLKEFWGIENPIGSTVFPVIAIPSMILYLALKYAHANLSLEEQLVEVKRLSNENLRVEQERQQFMASQNEMLEKQVAERTTELRESLNELQSTQALLIHSEKMASLGELTAGIAHEIQNPLNFVNNFSEVNSELLADLNQEIEKGNLKEIKSIATSLQENEEKIVHHGKRADSIVKGMLQHSRSSTAQKEPTNLNALCDEYLRLSFHGMRAKDKSLSAGQAGFNAFMETDFDQSIGEISVIPQDIGRVLLNLYNNAFFALMEKSKLNIEGYNPTITVITRLLIPSDDTHSQVEITVKDNGIGVPFEVRDKIFQPFFTTKPTGQGTGLGLSLSYDIVKAHGGELTLESPDSTLPGTKNIGAKFVIHLPLA